MHVKSIYIRLAPSLPIAALVVACSSDNPITLGSPTTPIDYGYTPADNDPDAGVCISDDDCSDHVFCNGPERCQPGAAGTNRRGCIRPLPTPCRAGQRCDESQQRCLDVCPHNPDADGDGHRSVDCGGDDCDDSDPNRFPGNPEICGGDPNHDEDCDPLTFGGTDVDRDGYASSVCCNTDRDGHRTCGPDCDDDNAGVHPGLPELCNGRDDNCDGRTDEDVKLTLYVDADHDGYGAPGTGSPQCPFTPGYSAFSNDCDDANAAIVPGAFYCSGAANTDTVSICEPIGVYSTSACSKGLLCVPQPNGTGVCR